MPKRPIQKQSELEDTDPMPFGMHQGKLMQGCSRLLPPLALEFREESGTQSLSGRPLYQEEYGRPENGTQRWNLGLIYARFYSQNRSKNQNDYDSSQS